jgi:hypothetical protein
MDYIKLIENSIVNAEQSKSKLTTELLEMSGYSGTTTRHFYNNLLGCDLKEDVRYLEIGTWKGSSLCSAMYGNSANVVCIDNWSEFGGPKDEFLANFNKYRGNNNAKYIEADCFKLDVSSIGKFNIYMYDGEHSCKSHYDALVHYYDCLDDTFIFIVDDWNWSQVREGTLNAIVDLKLTTLFTKEIRLTNDNTHTPMEIAKTSWWNGIYIAVLQKKKMINYIL